MRSDYRAFKLKTIFFKRPKHHKIKKAIIYIYIQPSNDIKKLQQTNLVKRK